MAKRTRSHSLVNRPRRQQSEPVIQPNSSLEDQNNQQPSSFPPPDGGDQDHITVLEAWIEALTWQDVELLLKISGQSHPYVKLG
jgi:hypothetical protein